MMKTSINEAVDVSSVIKGMQGNFGGDNASQAKGLQLLKGLAMSDDPKANEFMKALNTATTKISKEVLGGKSESTLTEGADAYCPNCGENNGKASEAMDDNGEVYCDNCGTSYFYESTSSKENILEAETFKCPDCGSKVLKQTGYCVSCKKKVGGKTDKKKESYTMRPELMDRFEGLVNSKSLRMFNMARKEITSDWGLEVGESYAEASETVAQYVLAKGALNEKALEEDIVLVKEDVKVGDIILEKGDQIRVLESSNEIQMYMSGENFLNFRMDYEEELESFGIITTSHEEPTGQVFVKLSGNLNAYPIGRFTKDLKNNYGAAIA